MLAAAEEAHQQEVVAEQEAAEQEQKILRLQERLTQAEAEAEYFHLQLPIKQEPLAAPAGSPSGTAG